MRVCVCVCVRHVPHSAVSARSEGTEGAPTRYSLPGGTWACRCSGGRLSGRPWPAGCVGTGAHAADGLGSRGDIAVWKVVSAKSCAIPMTSVHVASHLRRTEWIAEASNELQPEIRAGAGGLARPHPVSHGPLNAPDVLWRALRGGGQA